MRRTCARGFTLAELMVTIALVAILLTLGLPSFQDSIRRNRISTATNEFLAGLALARTEAIRSARGSGVCGANADGNGCVDEGMEWSNGLLIWTDANATRGFDAGVDTVVRRIQATDGVSVTVSAASSAPEGQIAFNSRGMAANGARTITLTPANCKEGEQLVREMSLTTVGQVSTEPRACE